MIKKLLLVMLVLTCLVGIASAIPGPLNVTTVNHTDHVHLYWDANTSADKYSVYEYNPAILYSNDTPVMDGAIDAAYNISSQFILTLPNQPYDDAYDTIRIIRTDTHAYITADTHDTGTDDKDDWVMLYVDFDSDGLTAITDKAYRVEEDGTVTRYQWKTPQNTWSSNPGTIATAVVSAAGTSNPIYELQIPFSELEGYNNVSRTLLWERSSNEGGLGSTRIYSYYPHDGDPTDTTNWASVNLTTHEGQLPHTTTNTTDTNYEVTGLDPFTWYRFGITYWNTSVPYESEATNVQAITSTDAMYTLTGHVYDEDTGEPIRNARVELSYQDIPRCLSETNVTGVCTIDDIWNGTFDVTVTKSGYVTITESITITGNTTENELFMVLGGNSYIPCCVWMLLILLSVVFSGYALLYRDLNNYSDVMASMASIIMWIMSGLLFFTGIVAEDRVYTSQYLAWLFIALGIIMALITAMRIFDVIKDDDSNRKDAW